MSAVVQSVALNPFPGLRPFRIEESHLFFGREGQTDEVLLKLSKHRFCGVIGPSGSGKSSFIFCGVLPILHGGFLAEESSDWEVIITRPGAGPMENLAQALLDSEPEYINADDEEKKIKKTIITTLLRSSSLGLVEAIQQSRKKSNRNFLILVDQFEELFRFKESREGESLNETLAFINLLMEAINYPDAPIYVAITMRSDFIGECAQFPTLTKKINDSHYLIPQLTREQKRKAIEGPVAVGGGNITARLVQLLLNDLGDNPDQLPILQHALMRTWDYWTRFRDYDDEPIDIKHYEAIGTMREALSLHANEAYDELDTDQKHLCEIIFKAITEKRGENFGIRRPTRLDEIASIAEVEEREIIEVVDKFREPGRSLLTPSYHVTLNSKSIIDISHESLMRIWVRLKNWVDDEAEAVQMYLRLAEAASMYQVGKAGLWRPPDLQLALNWQAKHKPTLVWGQRYHPAFERTMVFLEYSKKEFDTEERIKELQQKRRLRNARISVLIFAIATVISLAFLVYAFSQKTRAERETERAETEKIRADEARLDAENNAELARQREITARLEKQKADSSANVARLERANALEQQRRAEIESDRARREEARAVAFSIEANANAIAADSARKVAEANERLARIEKQRADQLRFLALAKAMAIKSTQFRDEQSDLKGLLAQQAYLFSSRYEGSPYDHDIYDGLYWALKSFDDPIVESLQGHNKNIRALESSAADDVIYSAGAEGKILRWRLTGETRVADTLSRARSNHIIRTMASTADGKWLAVGGEFPKNSQTSFIELYNLQNKQMQQVQGIRNDTWQLEFTPDNLLIALDEGGRSIKASKNFDDFTEMVKPSERINDIAITPDGSYLIGVAQNGKVFLYDIKNQFKESEIYDNRSTLWAVAISPKDNFVAIGDEDGLIKVFQLFSNRPVVNLVGHTSPITAIEFSTDSKFIATASKDKTVKLWSRSNLNTEPITLRDHPTWVWSIAFSPNNNQIMAGTQEDVVRAWATSIDAMTDRICTHLDRNMTADEWDNYVNQNGDIDYEKTCNHLRASND